MPRLSQGKRNSSHDDKTKSQDDKTKSQDVKKESQNGKRRSQTGKVPVQNQGPKDNWIFIINNEVVNTDCVEGDLQPSLCKLRHPRLDTGVMYLLSANCLRVFEVNCYKEKYRSWFIGNTVHSEGGLYMTSSVDPLFLVLQYMVSTYKKSSQFRTLDQIVCDEDFPDCHKLISCCSQDQLSLIADWKDIDDNLQVYRYSQEKTLCWLKSKTMAVANVLEQKKISVDVKGSHSAIFVRSKSASVSRDAYMEYAHGLISDYLSAALEKELRKYLDLPEVSVPASPAASQTENEPPNKKAKLSTEVTPTDDYSRNIDLKKDKSKGGKLSIAQKKLSKVDKTGMKSISSFFSPKS
ncbi:unnamed protein product [Candidula unifasciata]|uniref:Ribonuclease H2 subunit B n=1 Tax=Candidula unifasciata TaxID=100452 RepID=A0A8S3YVW4_9EUPU|nr:unnamed protein product [Candidula unifasciata]